MPKPAFDPSKPFEAAGAPAQVASGDKPKFDPSQPFQAADASTPSPDVGSMNDEQKNAFMLQRLKEGNESGKATDDAFLDQLTFGHTPQIKAKVAQIFNGEGVSNNEDYVKRRDQIIADAKDLAEKYPLAHKVGAAAGIAAPMLATGGGSLVSEAPSMMSFAKGLAKSSAIGAGLGAAQNPGDVAGVVDPIQAEARAKNAAIGATVGGGLALAAPVVGKVAGYLGEKSEGLAEKSAVNATGATGKQASKFEDGAGRQLLDRGIVRFGDNQATVASRAGKAVDAANAQIDSSLKSLEAKGVTVDENAIVKTIQTKIDELRGDSSSADVVRALRQKLGDVQDAIEARGSSDLALGAGEKTKRGYQRQAGNWADPEKGQAGKEMYQTYRTAVEDAAQAADPKTADLFREGKKSYGLLAPIQEAAERRAATTAQSPAGGLADISASAVGFVKGGPVGALVAPIARRMIGPRLASSVAVTADAVSKLLLKTPEMQQLATQNPSAYKAAVEEWTQKYNSTLPMPNGAGSELDKRSSTSAQEPALKGKDKWASDGLSKLLEHSGDAKAFDRSELLSDPKTKNLLIQASDLTPGSKAMEAVLAKIKAAKEDE